MYILISNDDGVQSPGLLALRQALNEVGETAVVAPDRNWSAAGHYRKLFDPLRAWEVQLADGSTAIASDGTPADCVALAFMGLLPRRPDIVVSGINLGANLGSDLTYSGTVAAAMEAIVYGVPGIAVSQVHREGEPWDFRAAQRAIIEIVKATSENGLPADLLLSVNIPPRSPELVHGMHITRLGQRIYRDELVIRHDPRGKPYYWIGGTGPEDHPEVGTDVGAIAAGYISITPIHMDLTSHIGIEQVRSWGLERDYVPDSPPESGEAEENTGAA